MATSLRRTGSVSTKRASATPSTMGKRGSTFLSHSHSVTTQGNEFGMITPGREGQISVDEVTGLRKIVEGLNKTNASLRARISDLETHIEHGTGPEVGRLSRELATLEDLFEQTQKDNEAKHAEGERQKVYVKELESLLCSSLGPDWRDSHNLFPPASTALVVTASTPLPKPKLANSHSLRHSVSFSNKLSASKSHRRVSSAMDLGLIGLQAVKEDEGGMDDTPTGALKRLNGQEQKGQTSRLAPTGELLGNSVPVDTRNPELGSSTTSEKGVKDRPVHSTAAPVGANEFRSVLQMLTPSDLVRWISDVKDEREAARLKDTAAADEREARVTMMRRLLADQERRLVEREAKLKDILKMAQEKEKMYDVIL